MKVAITAKVIASARSLRVLLLYRIRGDAQRDVRHAKAAAGLFLHKAALVTSSFPQPQAAGPHPKFLCARSLSNERSAAIPTESQILLRAYRLESDTVRARAAYNEFFTLWNSSDKDLAIAQEEYTSFRLVTIQTACLREVRVRHSEVNCLKSGFHLPISKRLMSPFSKRNTCSTIRSDKRLPLRSRMPDGPRQQLPPQAGRRIGSGSTCGSIIVHWRV
jgi:hypothetical protein